MVLMRSSLLDVPYALACSTLATRKVSAIPKGRGNQAECRAAQGFTGIPKTLCVVGGVDPTKHYHSPTAPYPGGWGGA